jgi:hypothetical protein
MKLLNPFKILPFILITLTMSFTLDRIPDVNKKVIEYVRQVIGERIGRGECWDLADQALTFAGAQFDKSSRKTIYIFGKLYDPEKEAIYPGDLIQFEGVAVSYKRGNMTYTENYKHHTAIVYQVNPDKSLQLAHQNTSFGGRKVELSDLDLNNVKKGKLYFYHPIP